MRFVKLLARWKFRYDLGQGFLSVLTFIVAAIAASDKIATLIPIPAKVLLAILVPTAVLFVVLVGWVLDRMKFQDAYQEELNRRNEMLRRACGKENTGQQFL